jgi:hypothetical protein
MCYPDTHHLSDVGPYGQPRVYDESPLLLPAVDGTRGLCATQQSQQLQLSMPAGYSNHYVRLHSSFRRLSQRRRSVAMGVDILLILLINRSPHEVISFFAFLRMKCPLDVFYESNSSPPRRHVPMLSPSTSTCPSLSNDIPHHPAWSSVRVSVTVVKGSRLDQCSPLAMICWTLSPFSPIVHSYLPFLSLSLHCAVTTRRLYHVLPLLLYICRISYPLCIVFTSFHQCFPYTFQSLSLSLAPHYIDFLSLSLIFLSFCLVKVETYQVSSSSLHMCSSPMEIRTLVYIVPRIVFSFVCNLVLFSHGRRDASDSVDGISCTEKRKINIILSPS